MTKRVVFLNDFRQMRFCSKGLRRYAAHLGVDWSDFLRDGIPIERLEQMDDVYVQEIVRRLKDGRTESDDRV